MKKVFLLHCVSNYPVEDREANLISVKYLKDKFNINIGYSDHTLGVEASIMAVSYGSKIIEKHFTLIKVIQILGITNYQQTQMKCLN